MAAALEEITALIAGQEDAARLADYRNYFVYEIGMRDRAGNRTTMSARALRGSGGEAQAPFYVAIAASLASAYYPGDRPGDENPGLGLCLLDEAFSKLDVRNSQALVDLYRAWGLQLLIAAPEDKRTTLTEVMDTIVTVYKSPDLTSVRIEAEHPLEAARRALHAINPSRSGSRGFRRRMRPNDPGGSGAAVAAAIPGIPALRSDGVSVQVGADPVRREDLALLGDDPGLLGRVGQGAGCGGDRLAQGVVRSGCASGVLAEAVRQIVRSAGRSRASVSMGTRPSEPFWTVQIAAAGLSRRASGIEVMSVKASISAAICD